VAVGDGVIDFPGILAVLAAAGFDGTLGVECDTLEQAVRSLPRLRALISAAARGHGKPPATTPVA
jgi:sugar phosphate isomerase/epimerase